MLEQVLWEYISQHGLEVAAYLILSTFTLVSSLGVPILIDAIIPRITANAKTKTLLESLKDSEPPPSALASSKELSFGDKSQHWVWLQRLSLRMLVLLLAVFWVVREVASFVLSYIDKSFIPGLRKHTADATLDRLLNRYRHQYEPVQLGQLLGKLVKLPLVLGDLATQFRLLILPNVYIGVGAIGYLFAQDPLAGLLALLYMVAIGIALGVGLHFSVKHMETVFVGLGETYNHLEDLLDNMVSVLNFATEKHERGINNDLTNALGQALNKAFWAVTATRTTVLILSGCFIFALLAILYVRSQGVLAPGVTGAALVGMYQVMYLHQMLSDLWQMVANIATLRHTDRYLQDLAEHTLPTPPHAAQPIHNGTIRFQDVTFQYAQRQNPVFRALNWTLAAGRHVELKGANGTGKTTLLELIAGRQHAQTGNITIGGARVDRLSPETLAHTVLMVPQTPILLNRTIHENIAYGSPGFTPAATDALLKQFGLYPTLRGNMSVGKQGTALSGGQRQIVYLMRLYVAQKPSHRVVLLDEPTAAIDHGANVQIVTRLVQSLIQDRTAVLVAHDDSPVSALFQSIDITDLR
jgi:ABC-type bacteriocin/lantibiotic exporter with double-glycine peptidase domain